MSFAPPIAAEPPDPRPRYAGYAIVALLLLVLIGLHPLAAGDKGAILTGDGDLLRQLSYLVVFGFTLFALRLHAAPFRALAVPLSPLLVLGWCALSLLWAIEPMIAFRRLALTAIIVVTVCAAVEHAGPAITTRAIGVALVLALAASYLALALSPLAMHFDPTRPELLGAWRGVMEHKNFAGAACGLTLLFFLFAGPELRWWHRLGVIAAAAIFLVGTRSKTSLLLVGVALLVGLIYLCCPPRQRPVLAFVAILALALTLIFGGPLIEQLASLFAQPHTFTGRGDIWPALIAYAGENPLFGAGYGSFWNIGAASPINDFAGNWVADLGNGHNGYLDLLVAIGVPGLLLAVVATVLLPALALLSSTIPRRDGALALAVLCFCTLHNLTESSLLDRDAIAWVFQLLAIALVARLARTNPAAAPEPQPRVPHGTLAPN